MTKEEKQQAVDILGRRLKNQRSSLADIETRLEDYFINMWKNHDDHNGYEILGAVKFLRLLRTYDFNHKKVRQVVWLREGDWHQEQNGRWVHDSDGLKCPGTDTAHVYRWQPFQIFVLASVFGFQSWVDTQVRAIDKAEILPTERVRDDGIVEDLRRLCNYFVCYMPRKTDKTGLSAYIQLIFFLMEDYNSEAYCCAMSEQQSKILFNRVKFMLSQLNEDQQWRMTEKIVDWKPQYRGVRNSSITPLTAGGKAKDGAFAQLVNWDEFGSSPYTNGKSDMQSLVNVMRSSMGPRREPLTFGTTTAGTISTGPFMDMLEGLHQQLLRELKYDTGEEQPTLSGDRSLCLLLEPDDWEKQDEEYLINSKELRRKINPMLGITCQHQFYEDSIEEMKSGKMTKQELIAKLFNVYESLRTTTWLKGDQVRTRQIDRRITDCWASQGWRVFCGLDFGGTDDIWAACYFAVNYHQDDPVGRFFADLDLWITEKALHDSPNRPLYEMWVRDGWMHVCPGEVFSHEMAVNQIMYRAGYDEQGRLAVPYEHQIDIRMFGYDPAQSIQPINQVKAWLQSLGIDAQTIKRMVIPVSQSFVTMNGLVQETEYMLLTEQPWLQLSMNPAWPWMFQNVKLEVSPNELKKPLKSNANSKVDGIHALLDGLYCFDFSEGQIQQ